MLNKITALYVEDEETIKQTVASIFSKMFKEFILADNGLDGLEKFKKRQNEIQIVITDINMPKMNGLDMAKGIREIDKDIPIVITTAHNDKEFLHKAIDVGITKFVTKPMDMKKLLETIKDSLTSVILRNQLEEQKKAYEEERLINAKFMATGQLAAGITHEINTPLTYIKANFEIMEYDIEDIEDVEVRENLLRFHKKINDGINRIANIVSSMREMSQQEKLEKVEANIYDTIVTSATLAYNKIKHASPVYINGKLFNLDMKKDELNFKASVELQRIEQVWIIIINNAMDELVKLDKPYEERKLDINISYNEKEQVVVSFKDNGGGFKENIQEHIFEPFKGTKISSGMGVGLSIAKRIIDDHKAKIEAYNEDDGAVFKITLS